jgi:hypothetical protein
MTAVDPAGLSTRERLRVDPTFQAFWLLRIGFWFRAPPSRRCTPSA